MRDSSSLMPLVAEDMRFIHIHQQKPLASAAGLPPQILRHSPHRLCLHGESIPLNVRCASTGTFTTNSRKTSSNITRNVMQRATKKLHRHTRTDTHTHTIAMIFGTKNRHRQRTAFRDRWHPKTDHPKTYFQCCQGNLMRTIHNRFSTAARPLLWCRFHEHLDAVFRDW